MEEPVESQHDKVELEEKRLEDLDYGREQLQRAVFPWVTFEDEKARYGVPHPEIDTTTAFEVAARYGVPEVVVTEYLHKEMKESESCWSLPFTLLLVVSYTGMMLTHLSQPKVYTVEFSIVNNIEENANFAFTSPYIGHKNVYDVNSRADFWSWMNHGLMPLLYIQERELSEPSRYWDPLEGDPRLDPDFLSLLINGTPPEEPDLGNETEEVEEEEEEEPVMVEVNGTMVEVEVGEAPYLNYKRDWDFAAGWLQSWQYTYDQEIIQIIRNGTNGTLNVTNITKNPVNYPPPLGPERDGRGLLLHYNRIVGGLRLSQERTGDPDTCAENFLPFYRRPCAGVSGYELEPVESEARNTEDPDEAYTTWLWTHDDLAKTHMTLHELEASGWLDAKTKKIEIMLPTYNTEYDLHTLVTINFFFSRGGHIWKVIIPTSVFSHFWFPDSYLYFYDIFYGFCILYIILVEGWEIYQTIKVSGVKGIWTEYIGFWNSVDWVSVVGGLLIVIIGIISYIQLHSMNHLLDELAVIRESDSMQRQQEFRSTVERYAEELWSGAQLSHSARVLYACYPFVIGMRLLKAYDAQPRLGMLTRTLVQAGSDLIHFMLVFLSILAAYATAGSLSFGWEVQEFATFPRSFISCTRAMMGDFNWEELVQVGRAEAGVWFMSFMVIVTLLMFNIIVAILMDAYGTVQATLQRADTLWTELKQAYTRWVGYQKGELVPMSDVLTTITLQREELPHLLEHARHIPAQLRQKNEAMPVNDTRLESIQDKKGEVRLITVEFLKDNVSKMRTQQAQALLEDCVMFFYTENKEDMDIGDVMRMVHDTDHDTSDLHAHLREICRRVKLKLEDSDLDEPVHHNSEKAAQDAEEDARLQALEAQVQSDFNVELDLCRQDLKRARMWIGVTVSNFHKENFAVHKRDPLEVQAEKDEEDRKIAEQMEEAQAKVDEAKDVISGIIHKLEVGRQTKREAVMAIAELETQLLELTDEVADANMELIGVRQQLLEAKNERKLIVEEGRRWQQDSGQAKLSQQECLDLTRTLYADNEALRERQDVIRKELDELEQRIHMHSGQVDAAMRRTAAGKKASVEGFTAVMKQLQHLEDVMEKERAGAELAGMDLSRFPVNDLYDMVDEGRRRCMHRISKAKALER